MPGRPLFVDLKAGRRESNRPLLVILDLVGLNVQMRYRLCDLVIDSEIELPELRAIDQPARTDLTVTRGPVIEPHPADHEWFHEWRYPDGELWSSFARTECGYVCRFEGIGDYQLKADGSEVIVSTIAGVPDPTLGHIFLNQIMPIVISEMNARLVLHASAVAIEGRAVAFLGMTGQGKSTLAGSLCAAGAPLITDDFLVVDDRQGDQRAVPTYGGLRLWSDVIPAVAGPAALDRAPAVAHYTEKKRIDLETYRLAYQEESVPIDRFYLLEAPAPNGGSQVTITPVSRRDAVVELTRFSFHLDLQKQTTRRAEFERTARVAAAAPVFRLSYPRTLAQLQFVREELFEHLRDTTVTN